MQKVIIMQVRQPHTHIHTNIVENDKLFPNVCFSFNIPVRHLHLLESTRLSALPLNVKRLLHCLRCRSQHFVSASHQNGSKRKHKTTRKYVIFQEPEIEGRKKTSRVHKPILRVLFFFPFASTHNFGKRFGEQGRKKVRIEIIFKFLFL
jgi:hypothetical protein